MDDFSENCCGKKPGVKSKVTAGVKATDTKPIDQLTPSSLAVLSDGVVCYRGYVFHDTYHDIHGRVIPDFTPTHFTLE